MINNFLDVIFFLALSLQFMSSFFSLADSFGKSFKMMQLYYPTRGCHVCDYGSTAVKRMFCYPVVMGNRLIL